MTRKSPWVAGVLNFFFPGLGFAYLGGTTYLIAGIGLFVVVLISGIMELGASIERPGSIALDLLASFALAGIAAETAIRQNRAGMQVSKPQ